MSKRQLLISPPSSDNRVALGSTSNTVTRRTSQQDETPLDKAGLLGIRLLIGLPDDVTYQIFTYLALPCNVVTVLSQSIAPLCHASRKFANENDHLWEAILAGYYKGNQCDDDPTGNSSGTGTASTRRGAQSQCSKLLNAYHARTQRRSSKRLRRTTAKEDVIHAHFVLRDQVSIKLVLVPDTILYVLSCIVYHFIKNIQC
jgi:hypothetical protein